MTTYLNDRPLVDFQEHGHLVLPAVFDGAEGARMRRAAGRTLYAQRTNVNV